MGSLCIQQINLHTELCHSPVETCSRQQQSSPLVYSRYNNTVYLQDPTHLTHAVHKDASVSGRDQGPQIFLHLKSRADPAAVNQLHLISSCN